MNTMRQRDLPTGEELTQTAPGLYVDEIGVEYFYLTGMYAVVMKCLGRHPLLNTPEFVVDILRQLRAELLATCSMELLD